MIMILVTFLITGVSSPQATDQASLWPVKLGHTAGGESWAKLKAYIHLGQWKTCLPQSWSLVPKVLGTICLIRLELGIDLIKG